MELKAVPHEMIRNLRNDMYVVPGAAVMKVRQASLSDSDAEVLKNYKSHIDKARDFLAGSRWLLSASEWER
jgi:hypothetical protein